jgi:hypothetical protein
VGRARVHLDADYADTDADAVLFCAAAARLGVPRGALLKELVHRFLESCEEEINEERAVTEAKRRTFRRKPPP